MKYEIAKFPKYQLPQYFIDDNPRFIRLLELYYQWLYRKDGLSELEILDVKDNISTWSQVDIDRFLLTGSPRFNSFAGLDQEVLAEVTQWRAPGALVDRFRNQYLLEREFDSFVTADGEYFFDESGVSVESGYQLEDAIQNWAFKFNHERFSDSLQSNPHDELLLIKCMKMIYAAKGTNKCIELFFKVYFNEDVDIYIPKFDICYVDDAPCVDMNKYIRDDFRYQEYCYVIRTNADPAPYQDTFKRIYMKQFHPGGFNVILEQKPTT